MNDTKKFLSDHFFFVTVPPVDKKEFTVHDVLERGYNLEPLTCLHCGHEGEVTYHQYIGDAFCEMCGEWQLGKEVTK